MGKLVDPAQRRDLPATVHMIDQKLILLPLLTQVSLTAVVFFRMYFARIAEMKSKRIHPQKIATSSTAAEQLTDSIKIADNFSNQFELPVLFYVLIALLLSTQMVDMPFIVMSWLFVALRVAHSVIHCGCNKVIHRFYTYAAGSIVLWAMWILFTLELINSL